jgi:hypothetical protein
MIMTTKAGTIFGREPALIYALINSGIAVAVTFGLQLDPNQIGAILVFTNMALAFATRQAVVPNVTHLAEVSDALYKGQPNMPDLTVLPPAAAEVKEEIVATRAEKAVEDDKVV